MGSIDLREINYEADLKTVGKQIAQEIRNAGYEQDLAGTIKKFESGNIEAFDQAYEELEAFRKLEHIEFKSTKKNTIKRIAKQILSTKI